MPRKYVINLMQKHINDAVVICAQRWRRYAIGFLFLVIMIKFSHDIKNSFFERKKHIVN